MQTHMSTLRSHQTQVFDSIVRPALVFMMHNFPISQVPPYILLHHKPMFQNVPITVRFWVTFRQYIHVALMKNSTPFKMCRRMTDTQLIRTTTRTSLRRCLSILRDFEPRFAIPAYLTDLCFGPSHRPINFTTTIPVLRSVAG